MPTQLRRFEGSRLEDLLRQVRTELGPQARIVGAERTRTGGLLGFFARENFRLTVQPCEQQPSATTGSVEAPTEQTSPPEALGQTQAELAESTAAFLDALAESTDDRVELAHTGHAEQCLRREGGSGRGTERVQPAGAAEQGPVGHGADPRGRVSAPIGEGGPERIPPHIAAPAARLRPSIGPRLGAASFEEVLREVADEVRTRPVGGEDGTGPRPATVSGGGARGARPRPADPSGDTLVSDRSDGSGGTRSGLAGETDGTASFLELARRVGVRPELVPPGLAPLRPQSLVEIAELVLEIFGPMPPPPSLRPPPGYALAVVGEAEPALRLARVLAEELGLASDAVLFAAPPDAELGRAVLRSAEQARRAVDRRRRRDGSAPVLAVSATPAGGSRPFARRLLAAVQPALVVGTLGACTNPDDALAWVAAIGGVDALALHGVNEACAPALLLSTGLPVARLDAVPATGLRWATAVLDALDRAGLSRPGVRGPRSIRAPEQGPHGIVEAARSDTAAFVAARPA